jgi:hypothetical protein
MEQKEEEGTVLRNFSQAGQDVFVSLTLDRKQGGLFVDLGAGHPQTYSNTFGLEKFAGWRGILADIETVEQLKAERDPRNLFYGNALDPKLMADILTLADANEGTLDYLSLDLEPPESTLAALYGLPLDQMTFAIATVEHDLYRGKQSIKFAIEGILQGYGYRRVAENVRMIAKNESGYLLVPVEDWWVHPSLVDVHRASEVAADVRREQEIRLLEIIERLNAEEANG